MHPAAPLAPHSTGPELAVLAPRRSAARIRDIDSGIWDDSEEEDVSSQPATICSSAAVFDENFHGPSGLARFYQLGSIQGNVFPVQLNKLFRIMDWDLEENTRYIRYFSLKLGYTQVLEVEKPDCSSKEGYIDYFWIISGLALPNAV